MNVVSVVKRAVRSGDFSMTAAHPSAAEPIRIDSDTNVLRRRAMARASSMVEAYCRISRVSIDIGVADDVGTADLAALMVTVRPASFIPDITPIIPGQLTEANLYPLDGK